MAKTARMMPKTASTSTIRGIARRRSSTTRRIPLSREMSRSGRSTRRTRNVRKAGLKLLASDPATINPSRMFQPLRRYGVRSMPSFAAKPKSNKPESDLRSCSGGQSTMPKAIFLANSSATKRTITAPLTRSILAAATESLGSSQLAKVSIRDVRRMHAMMRFSNDTAGALGSRAVMRSTESRRSGWE